MLSKLVKAVVTLSVLAAAGGVYWRVTAMDRVLKRATGYPSDAEKRADAMMIAAHPKDPRSLAYAWILMKDIASSCGNDWRPEERVQMLNAVFAARPIEPTDRGADAVVAMIAHCKEPKAKTWGTFDDAMLVRAMRKLIFESGQYLQDTDALFAWLEERHVAVSDDLIAAAVFALGQSPRAAKHLTIGFPPNGDKLAPVIEQSARIPIDQDPRIVTALAAGIERNNHYTPGEASFAPLHALTSRIQVPATDDVIRGLLHMGNYPAALDVAADVLTVADLPKLRTFVTDEWTANKVAAIAARLGGAGEGDVQAILNHLLDFVAGHPSATNDERQAAVYQATAALKPLGKVVIPTLAKALASKTPEVRDVAIASLHELDPDQFMMTMATAAERNLLGPQQLKAVIAMVGPKPDPRLYFALMASPGFAREAATALKATLPPAEITRAIFEHLAIGTSFGVGEVQTYVGMLGTDAAPTVSASLEDALAKAGGKPESVYWLAKIVGLRALASGGGAKQRATVEKFVADRSTYIDERTETKGTQVTKKETDTKYFSTMAQEALAEIDARAKR